MKRIMLIVSMSLLFTVPVLAEEAATPPAASPVVAAAPQPAAAAPQPAADQLLTLSRMEVCSGVTDRQPVDPASAFPADQEKVFCFLEFGGAKRETTVTVVWTLGQMEMGRMNLPVRRYPMFRTWANKTVTGMKGDWRVDVLDEKGVLLRSAKFQVQ